MENLIFGAWTVNIVIINFILSIATSLNFVRVCFPSSQCCTILVRLDFDREISAIVRAEVSVIIKKGENDVFVSMKPSLCSQFFHVGISASSMSWNT